MLSGAPAETPVADTGTRSPQARRAFRSVQDPPDRLTYKSPTKSAFNYELLTMFVKNELSAAITTPLLAVVVATGAMFWSPPHELLIWLCGIFVTKGILIAVCRQFAKVPREQADVEVWQRKITSAEFLYGLTWASVLFISPLRDEVAGYTFIFAALLVVISMRMLFASTAMPIVYAGTLPITTAIVIRFVLLNDPFYWAMAIMAVAVHLYFVWLMHGFSTTVLSMLEFRAEKDALIGELEQSKSISDQARLRAEEANLAKSRFLATMSHELRTPLNAILGFSEIMRDEAFGAHANPTYKEYARDIHNSGKHLLTLIDEILDISRIEAGRYELHDASVSLTDIADDCHRLMRVRAENKGLEIRQAFEDNLPNVWADERALRQICLNLLSNAIKFTPPKGTITLTTARTEDGGIALTIKDTGPGIPGDEIPRVLSSFGQGSLAHETAEGGTGLGLPITKGLIELHGGSFELNSELRCGTEVTITLPPARVMEDLSDATEPGETGRDRTAPTRAKRRAHAV